MKASSRKASIGTIGEDGEREQLGRCPATLIALEARGMATAIASLQRHRTRAPPRFARRRRRCSRSRGRPAGRRLRTACSRSGRYGRAGPGRRTSSARSWPRPRRRSRRGDRAVPQGTQEERQQQEVDEQDAAPTRASCRRWPATVSEASAVCPVSPDSRPPRPRRAGAPGERSSSRAQVADRSGAEGILVQDHGKAGCASVLRDEEPVQAPAGICSRAPDHGRDASLVRRAPARAG